MKSDDIFQQLTEQQQDLQQHSVFSLLRSVQDLQRFMSWHVFAVWDFMSLVKRLQRELTRVDTPWTPSPYPQAARLINEIVLGEESDQTADGGFLSHYELYVQAMREVGADTSLIEQVVLQVATGSDPLQAMRDNHVPLPLQQFVTHTLHTAQQGHLIEVLGNFFFGREDIIPRMFQGLLDQWQIDTQQAPVFVYYLKRHIELDADEHGPAARQLIETFMAEQPATLTQLKRAAEAAIRARHKLWDALAVELQQQQANPLSKAS